MGDQPPVQPEGPPSTGAGAGLSAGVERQILDSLLEGCMVIGFDWTYLYVNEAAARHGQSRRESLLGRTMPQAYPGIEENPTFVRFKRCMEERDRQSFESDFTFPDGSTRSFEVRVSPVPEGIFVLTVDVTERKRAEAALRAGEEHFRLAFENANIGMCLVDLQGRLFKVNRRMSEIFGYSRSELEAMNFNDIAHPDFRDVSPRFIHQASEGEADRIEFEKEYIHKDGRLVWGRVASSLVRDARGEPLCFISHVVDISEKREAEEKILRMNRELEDRVAARTAEVAAAARELEVFSYSVSHDLRAPLRAIEGFAGMIVTDDSRTLAVEDLRRLDVIRKNARRMAVLIDDLLTFTRSGRQEVRSRRLLMKFLARSAFEEVVPDPEARARIDFRLEPVPEAFGDATLVRQVWINLIGNAVKYSSRRERPEIEVAGSVEGAFAVYRVRDNGVGFDMSHSGGLFGVFRRLHSFAEFEGTGVGLALVRRIVERHGGRAWAEAQPGAGATFSFSLPVDGGGEKASP